MRKMATIRQIDALNPIEGADAIECATIGGWKVVVKKGEFKAGDLVGFNWSGFVADGNLPKVELVFRPTSKQALQGVGVTKRTFKPKRQPWSNTWS